MTDSKTATELRPCPICGADAQTWNTPHVGGLHDCAVLDAFGVAVECSKCGLSTRGYFSEEQAIEAWNTRTPETCKMQPTFTKPATLDGIQEFECSKCGEFTLLEIMSDGERPNFCQHCGREVIDDD